MASGVWACSKRILSSGSCRAKHRLKLIAYAKFLDLSKGSKNGGAAISSRCTGDALTLQCLWPLLYKVLWLFFCLTYGLYGMPVKVWDVCHPSWANEVRICRSSQSFHRNQITERPGTLTHRSKESLPHSWIFTQAGSSFSSQWL